MDDNLLINFTGASNAQLLSALLYARCKTWILEGQTKEIEQFYKRWAPFSRETLLRILEDGTRLEKVCSLFSLGHLGYGEDRSLLLAYLHSADAWERWASAIELWKQGEKKALPVLHALICDEQQTLEKLWHNPVEDPANFAFWSAQARRQVILLLAKGGNEEVIPIFADALRWCWKMERHLDGLLERWEDLREALLSWEDTLLYVLGQFHLWDPDLQNQLPAGRFRIAQVLWVLGFLQAHNTIPDILRLLGSPMLTFAIPDYIVGRSKNSIPFPSIPERLQSDEVEEKLSISRVKAILGQHFALSPEQQDSLLAQFPKDCLIRTKDVQFLSFLKYSSSLSLSEIRKIWMEDFSLTGEEPEAWAENDNITPSDKFDPYFDPYQDDK